MRARTFSKEVVVHSEEGSSGGKFRPNVGTEVGFGAAIAKSASVQGITIRYAPKETSSRDLQPCERIFELPSAAAISRILSRKAGGMSCLSNLLRCNDTVVR